MEAAQKDFNKLNEGGTVKRGETTVGQLPDGTKINVRSESSDSCVTLEIQGKGQFKIKIRYNDCGGKVMGIRQSEFVKWTPVEGVDNVYDIDDITINTHGITFVLIPDSLDHKKRSPHIVKITWNDIISYQLSQETYRDEYWISQSEEAWTFYVSQKSTYLCNFKEKSALFPENTVHFVIIGTNWIADILATDYPTVTIEKSLE